jgi:ribosomal protein S19
MPHDTPIANNMYFWKRSSLLNKRLAKTNKTIGIYNGFGFVVLHLKKRFFGYRLGEYSVTRRAPRHKGKQRQKKKVK